MYMIALIFSLLHVYNGFAEEVPIIKTPLGLVSGVYEISHNGRIFSAFYGIPYAKPPIGELRFEEPQKISSWDGIWKAANKKLSCAQVNHVPDPPGGSYKGDEDCLYLNIFFPGKKLENNHLDVIAYIHGGAFMFGAGNLYGPKFLMDRDTVLVTINYRLGVLGFLSTEDEVVPGNNGLKDQTMALQWIKDNIEYFGGNPNSVTLTGLSAGGASVHFHFLSPLSKELFHRGISMSGTALGPSKMQENALEKARIIGAHLGCTQKSTKKMIKCIKQRSTRDVVESIRILRPWLYNPYSPLSAVVEKKGKRRFLTEQPWYLLATGKFQDLPWLNSVTSAEGLYPGAEFLVNDNYIEELNTKWNDLIPYVLDYNYTIPIKQRDVVSQTIRKAYLGDELINITTNFKKVIDMISDRMFCVSAEEASKLQAEKSSSEGYYYYFSYMAEEKESDTDIVFGIKQTFGVAHGDDTMYIFSNPSIENEKLSENDKKIKDMMLDMWISFAKSNVPIALSNQWLPVSKEQGKPLLQLHISSPAGIFMEDVEVIDRKRSVWKSIPFEENENLFSKLKRDEL